MSYYNIDELQLRRSLMHIIEQTKNPGKLTVFLKPYVTRTNISSLQTLYNCIESRQDSLYSTIDNVVNDCLSNNELYLIIRKMITQFTN